MKKWFLGGVAAVVALGTLATIVAVTFGASLMGGVVGNAAGALGAMFADKEVQKQYGLNGCLPSGGLGVGIPVTANREEYVRTTIGVAKSMGISELGQVAAVMTMLQETTILNMANDGKGTSNLGQYYPAPGGQFWRELSARSLTFPNDRVGSNADSVGLYQQRASMGWADDSGFKALDDPDEAIRRLLDPRWNAQAFFGGPGGPPNPGLLDIPNWQSKRPGELAQIVQISPFPDEYHKWEAEARALVRDNSDAPPISLFRDGGAAPSQPPGSASPSPSTPAPDSDVQFPVAEGTYTLSSPYGPRRDPMNPSVTAFHRGVDFAAPFNTPIYAIADGTVTHIGYEEGGYGNWIVLEHTLNGQKYSSVYAHMAGDGVLVTKGQKVAKGQKIALVGSEGKSNGPHLHFELWKGGRLGDTGVPVDPMTILGTNVTSGGQLASECGADGTGQFVGSFSGDASGMLSAFQSILGIPYSWGGGTLQGPSEGILYNGIDGRGIIGFDCSSAVRYAVYKGTNGAITLPRTATQQYNYSVGNTVWKPGQDTSGLQPGDLLFYGTSTSNIVHVTMYIGNGRMFEAPQPGMNVRETALRTNSMVAATRLNLGSGFKTPKG